MSIVHKIRTLGVRVAIDGVGADASRVLELTNLPVDGIKIDRSVVTLIDRSAERRALVREIVDQARKQGLTVNCVGVESLDQAERLWDLGAEEAQGPLFFKSVSEDHISSLFTSDATLAAD